MTESSENSESISSILNNRQYTDNTNDELTEYDQSDMEECLFWIKREAKTRRMSYSEVMKVLMKPMIFLSKYLFKYFFILKLKRHAFRAAN
jgi:hypothetical protein